MVRVAIAIMLLMLLPSATAAQQRIALLIGNQGYNAKVGPLKNPHKDIVLVGAALEKLGFKTKLIKDAGYKAFDTALKLHIQQVRRAGKDAISFVYYSGHGAANPDNQINYLIPVDVTDADDAELWLQSFELTDIIDKLRSQSPDATHYVVFDACRDELKLTRSGKSVLGSEKGFVPVANTSGVMIAYATAPGRAASDVGQGGGPYAKALAEEIVKPGIEAVTMFRNVQLKVKQAINQDPWLSFPTLPALYFAGTRDAPTAAPTQQSAWSTAEREWQQYGKETKDIRLLEAFKEKHKDDPFYVRLAEARIEELKKQQETKPETSGPSLWERITGSTPSSPPRRPGPPEQVANATPPAQPAQPKLKEPAAASTPTLCDGIEIAVGQNERQCFKPGAGKTEHFKDCPACPEMVVAPAGNFTMGSPASEPQRNDAEVHVRVTNSAPFAVGTYAVTFDEWDACVADGGCNGYKPSDQGWGRGKRPVINVNWDDAKAYAAWVSRKTGKTYRLLSEAEREYLTRAETTTPFWWGSSITPKQANYDGNYSYAGGGSMGEYRQHTVSVDSFELNPWGLYNVHGNVWEWTEDCRNDSNTGNPGDGRARTTGTCTQRVVRGSSWLDDPQYLRSASRHERYADIRYYYVGFRLARTLAP